MKKIKYFAWTKRSSIVILWISVLFSFLIASFAWLSLFFLIGLAPALILLPITLQKTIASFRLSPRYGNFQGKINKLCFDIFDHNGKILEIGCANAHLLIDMCEKFPKLEYHGIDIWHPSNPNSLKDAQRNAQNLPIQFHKGSAHKLPFEKHSFNSVLSVMTFHQVEQIVDKTMSIREALRVLKVGGCFCFIDTFADTLVYPSHDWIIKAIQESGGKIHKIRPIKSLLKIPLSLRHELQDLELIMGAKH